MPARRLKAFGVVILVRQYYNPLTLTYPRDFNNTFGLFLLFAWIIFIFTINNVSDISDHQKVIIIGPLQPPLTMYSLL